MFKKIKIKILRHTRYISGVDAVPYKWSGGRRRMSAML
jgi:hypothetical protein